MERYFGLHSKRGHLQLHHPSVAPSSPLGSGRYMTWTGPSLAWGKAKFAIHPAQNSASCRSSSAPTPRRLLRCQPVVSITQQTLRGQNGPRVLLKIPGFSVNGKDANDRSGRNWATLAFGTTKFPNFVTVKKCQAWKQKVFEMKRCKKARDCPFPKPFLFASHPSNWRSFLHHCLDVTLNANYCNVLWLL